VKLSIVIPVHDDGPELIDVVKGALAVDYGCQVELLVVQREGSRPPESLGAVDDDPRIRLLTADRCNRHALRVAADAATGDYLIALDAGQEYDPADIRKLLRAVADDRQAVVFGTRMFGTYSGTRFWSVVGDKLITTAGNVIFNCYLSDLETGYKLMPVTLYRSLDVKPGRFAGDAALIGKLLRRGIRPYEVPVSYHARPAGERREIRWWNRVEALAILVRERFRRV